jgi:hypothetical protein
MELRLLELRLRLLEQLPLLPQLPQLPLELQRKQLQLSFGLESNLL